MKINASQLLWPTFLKFENILLRAVFVSIESCSLDMLTIENYLGIDH